MKTASATASSARETRETRGWKPQLEAFAAKRLKSRKKLSLLMPWPLFELQWSNLLAACEEFFLRVLRVSAVPSVAALRAVSLALFRGHPSFCSFVLRAWLLCFLVAVFSVCSLVQGGEMSGRPYYDKNNRLLGVEYSNGYALAYQYDGNDNLVRQIAFMTGSSPDGLPALWKFINGFSVTNSAGNSSAYADPDGDGWTNLQEWRAGTNPNDSNSVPSLQFGAGQNLASLGLPFTPTNFVVATGQLDGYGADEIVVGADGNPGTTTNALLILTQEAFGWSTQRVDVGSVGITSIAIGQVTNRDSVAIYFGTRTNNGPGNIVELMNQGGNWQMTNFWSSTGEAASVLGVRQNGDLLASLNSGGSAGALYSLSYSNGVWSSALVSTNRSGQGPGTHGLVHSRITRDASLRLVESGAIEVIGGDSEIFVNGIQIPTNSVFNSATGKWYIETPTRMTWQEAQDYFRSLQGNLVTITSSNENAFLYSQFTSVDSNLPRFPGPHWIGLQYTIRATVDGGGSSLPVAKWVGGIDASFLSFGGWGHYGFSNPLINWPRDLTTSDGVLLDVNVVLSGLFWEARFKVREGQLELFYGIGEVSGPSVLFTNKWDLPPPATNLIFSPGLKLASGTVRANQTNTVSVFHASVQDKNVSGRIDPGDDFLLVEYEVGKTNYTATNMLARIAISQASVAQSYGLAAVDFRPFESKTLFTAEPDGQLFSWQATDAGGNLERRLFSSTHQGKAWHVLSSVKLPEPGEGLIGLRVDPTNQSSCDVIFWAPRTTFESPPDIPQTAPMASILPEPISGGTFARVAIRLWDAEGNSSLPELQYFNPVSSNWVNAASLSIDGRAVTYVAATPTGSDHEMLWNVKGDLNLTSGVTTNVQLRVRASDNTHYGNYIGDWSAPMSYTVVVPLDYDSDGIPDDWEVAHNLNPQDASDAARDDDGDGFTNLEEYIAGTDPVNPASALRITAIRESGADVRLDFDSISGKMYRVESKDSLSDVTWTEIDEFTSNITGTQTFEELDAITGSTKFYRIKCGPNGEVVSDPAGYYGVTHNAGPNAISVPLHNFATARGLVDSVSGNMVTMKVNPGWTANAFAPKDGYNQYIMLVRKDASASPGIEGDWWTIASNTSNTLTLNAGTDVLSSLLGSGDQIEVRRLTSMKDLFGTGPTLILNKDSDGSAAAGDFSKADVIRFISGTSFQAPIFYHDGTMLPAGYYIEGGNVGPLDGSTITVLPGQGFMVFRKAGSSPTTVLVNGQVQVSRLTEYLNVGPNIIGLPFAAAAPIGTNNLKESGWVSDHDGSAAAGDFSKASLLRLITGTAFGPPIFHHDGSLTPTTGAGWYDAGGVLNNSFPLQPGRAYIFFITPTNAVRWRQAVPYAP